MSTLGHIVWHNLERRWIGLYGSFDGLGLVLLHTIYLSLILVTLLINLTVAIYIWKDVDLYVDMQVWEDVMA